MPGAVVVPRWAVSGREGAWPPRGGSLPAACQSRPFPPPRGLSLPTALHPIPFLASCPHLKSTESLILENPFIRHPAAHSLCHTELSLLTWRHARPASISGDRLVRSGALGPASRAPRSGSWYCGHHVYGNAPVPWPVMASWSFCHQLGGSLQGPLKSLSRA